MTLQPHTQSGPVYLGLKAALDADDALAFDLRPWRRYPTAPIDLVRHDVRALGFEPHTTLFGEEVERQFMSHLWEYFRWRNYQRSLDIYAEDLKFGYVYWFDHDDATGERVHLTVCVTPPLGFADDAAVLEEISRVIAWLQPHFGDALTVSTCPKERLDVHMQIAGMARVRQTVRAVPRAEE